MQKDAGDTGKRAITICHFFILREKARSISGDHADFADIDAASSRMRRKGTSVLRREKKVNRRVHPRLRWWRSPNCRESHSLRVLMPERKKKGSSKRELHGQSFAPRGASHILVCIEPPGKKRVIKEEHIGNPI